MYISLFKLISKDYVTEGKSAKQERMIIMFLALLGPFVCELFIDLIGIH